MNNRKPVTLHRLREMHAAGEKIAVLTCYDAAFARVLDDAGVESLLVGDSLGNGAAGASEHARRCPWRRWPITPAAWRAAIARAWIIADLPFGSYQESAEVAMRNAALLMQQGAHMVKLEGGGWTAPIVRFLVDRGVPVCAHLGFTPQSVHALGGYRVQGRDEAAAARAAPARRGTGRGRSGDAGSGNGAGRSRARSDQDAAHPDHRHRRRRRLQRPGSGAARHAGIDERRAAAVRAQFPGRQRRHRARRAASMWPT